MVYLGAGKCGRKFHRRKLIFARAYFIILINASHWSKFVCFLPKGTTSSASRPEIFLQMCFVTFYGKKGLDFAVTACFILPWVPDSQKYFVESLAPQGSFI